MSIFVICTKTSVNQLFIETKKEDPQLKKLYLFAQNGNMNAMFIYSL